MSWVYSEADYEGIVDDAYQKYAFFGVRGGKFNSRLSHAKGQKVLVAGCGFGYLVQELMQNHGFVDVWGCDASTYAVQTAAPAELGQYASRIVLGDLLGNLNPVRQAAGLRGKQTFAVCISEDVLPCASSIDEAHTMLNNMRSIAGQVEHVITPQMRGSEKQPDGSTLYPGGTQVPGFLWLTHQEWIDLIGPGESIMFTDSYEVVNI